MFRAIIAFSLRRRGLVLGVAAIVLVYGAFVLRRIPVDVFPDLNRPTVTLLTEAPGLAPEEVEPRVTFPVETAMRGLPGVEHVRSQTAIGLSVVRVEFGWGTEIYRARQLVTERLGGLVESLPPGIVPTMGPISSLMGEILLVGVTGPGAADPAAGDSPLALRDVADWTIRPRLLSVPGVSQVIVMGGARRELHVRARPLDLQRLGVSLSTLVEAVERANRSSGGGVLRVGASEVVVRALARVVEPEQLAAAVLGDDDPRRLRVGDVADVLWSGPLAPRGTAGVNGHDAVVLSVQKQPGADTIAVTAAVDRALDGLRSSLPAGTAVNANLFRQERFIHESVQNVEHALRDGAILVALVLFLFLWNFRTTFITLTAIPLSFVTSVLVFHAFGLTIDTMTLGGLSVALGEVVDDAIVDIENVFRRLKQNRASDAPRSALRVVLDASNEVRTSIVLATATVIVVFLPLFFLESLEGRLFRPLGVAYVVSILASLLVSLTVTPALSSLLLPRAKATGRPGDGLLVRALKAIDRRQLALGQRFPWLVVGAAAALLVGAVALYARTGSDFLPPFNEGTATVNVTSRPGISIEASTAMGRRAEALLLGMPEVVSVGRRTGRAEMDEHAEGVHYTEIDVDFRPGSGTRSQVLEKVRLALADLPGVSISVGQPIAHRLDHLLTGVRAQVAVKVFGPELPVLRGHAESVRAVAATVAGVRDLAIERQVLVPQVRVEPRREALARLGLHADAVARYVETAQGGRTVTQIVDGDRTYPVVVSLAGAIDDVDALRHAPFPLPDGSQVPLSDVAQVLETLGPNQVLRDDAQRRVAVTFNVEGRDLGSVVEELRGRLAREVEPHLPMGYHLELGGQFEAQQAASRLLLGFGIAGLLVVFALLWAHFRSVGAVVQILLNVPFALIGSVVATWWTGGVVTIAHLVGFVSLTGIAARNGIMMIDHYRHLVLEEGESFTPAMIVRGSLDRLVPVLMTASTAILGLVPVALAAGQPGKEILFPVAVVVLGGLVSSTILDIVVTPVVFRLFGRRTIDAALRRRAEEASDALA